jgi:pimeloyl-ACP methyl ester carboxylesterase
MILQRRAKNAARVFHNSTDERIDIMQMPVALKPAIWGAVAGAAALAIVGFSWGGWVSRSSAELHANEKAATAVAGALAPICLENFRRAADAPAKLLELKKANSWEQVGFIEKGGWARMPGSTAIDPVMARACATLIISDKS